jgi:WD40 repeat protein
LCSSFAKKNCLKFQISGDGNNCVSVGMDKCLKLWDIRSAKCVLSISMDEHAEMNYVSLSENTKNFNTLKASKKPSSSLLGVKNNCKFNSIVGR